MSDDTENLDDLCHRYHVGHLVRTPFYDALQSREQRLARAEDKRIAKAVKEVARKLLHADDADAVDGYVAASMIEMARVLEETGKVEG